MKKAKKTFPLQLKTDDKFLNNLNIILTRLRYQLPWTNNSKYNIKLLTLYLIISR